MNIQERSFSGKLFQPLPKYHLSINKKIVMAITPWGQKGTSPQDIFQNIENLYGEFVNDKEFTHPFPIMLSLSPTENNIRTTITQINKNIYDSLNQSEYSSGFELFFGTVTQNIFTFIQIGKPLVLIDRPHQDLQSIGQMISPSLSTPNKKNAIPPLPHQLLGIHNDISFHTFYFRVRPKDKLILLSRNTIPTSWFTLKTTERTLTNLSKLTAEDQPHTPFNIAIIEL